MNNESYRILKLAILEASTWNPSRSRFTLENDFYQLMLSGPATRDVPELWKDYRRALAENPHLEDPDLRQFLKRPQFAKEGFWWFDPSEWTTLKAY